jgi:hypothetical protein
LIFPDGEQSNAFLATSTQLNSIFGYTPLDTSAFTGFSNLVLSAGYLTADSNWLFDAIGSAATVQSNLNATWNGSTNKYMGGDLTLTGTVQVAAIVWSNVGSTLLTTQTMAGITNLVSTTGAQSFAITNGSVFVTDTNFTLANFAPTTATQIVTNNGSGYTVDFTLATGPTALLSNQFTTLGQLDDKLNAIVGEVWFGTTNIHPNTLLVGDLQFTRTAVDAWTNTYSATAASNYLGTLYMTNPIVGGITAGPYIHTVYAAVSSAAGSPAYHSRLVMSDGTTTNVLGVGTSFPLTTKAQANDSSMFLSTNVVVSATNMFLGISRYVTRTVGGGTASIYGGTGFFTHLTLPSTTFNSSYTLTAAEMTSVIPTLVTNTTIDGFGINNGTLTGVVAAVTYDSVTNVLGGRPVEVVMGVYTCTNSETAVNIGPIGNYGSNTYLWVATLSALTATNVQSDYNMCKVNNIGTGGYMIAGVRFQGNATVNFQDNAPIYFDNVSGYRTPRFSFGKIRFDNYWQSAGTIGGSNIVANFSTEFYKQVVNTPGPNEQKLWGYVSPWSGTNSLPITNLTIYTNSGNGWTNGSKIVWGIGYLSQ